MIPPNVKVKNNELPDVPGVYLMKDASGTIIYVGKATSLKRRVSSYFQRPHDARIQEMVSLIRSIDYIEQPTAIEALILEANLIKFYWPHYNILEKDDKSFLYLAITNEPFPRPLLIRGSDLPDDAYKTYKAVFGPYTSGRSLKSALEIVRRAIAWSTCEPGQKRACFYYHLKQCPGVCIGAVTQKEYGKIIRDLIKFFEGKKGEIVKRYRKEMMAAAKDKKFEEAAVLRNKIFALEHIQDIAVMRRDEEDADTPRSDLPVDLFGRIEGYDISHVSGTAMVASMVVFERGAPAKAEYRRFRIKTVEGSNDVASLKEVLTRRFRNPWRKPDVLLIDGGIPQVNAAHEVVHEQLHLNIPIVGIAKGPARDRNDLVCRAEDRDLALFYEHYKPLLVRVRDEAHRFAITYHRNVRSRKMLGRT